jgi:hypothetical protein
MPENPPYHYGFTHLDTLFELSYTPDKLMELLEEAILLLVALLKYEPSQQEAVMAIHRALYELRHALRNTKPAYAEASADKPLNDGDQGN